MSANKPSSAVATLLRMYEVRRQMRLAATEARAVLRGAK